MLGSRNARRQVQAVLAHAAEFGAYHTPSASSLAAAASRASPSTWLATSLAVERCALHRAWLQHAPCSPRRRVVVRPGKRSRRRALLRCAGSINGSMRLDSPLVMTFNQKMLSNHKRLLKRHESARAAAGRAKGAAHGAQLAVARRRQWQQ